MNLGHVRRLLTLRGDDLVALGRDADARRREQVGDDVTYVVNRNINFTNVCAKSCHFCAFARGRRSEQAYLLPEGEIVRRAVEAWELGASEVCLQAGLHPDVDGMDYVRLVELIRAAAPGLHLHAFSPAEVTWGAGRAGLSVVQLLTRLRDAGLGSVPGTSAEILDDGVRRELAPGRISTAQWVEVIRGAHDLGIPTTSTMMFGHLETPEHVAAHLLLLRDLQRETGGFTEFVPLAFVHAEAPLFARRPDVRPGAESDEIRAVYATARMVLGEHIPNLQVSWVKHGVDEARDLLDWGVNDLGGTLINESISTTAGAGHGQLVTPAALRGLIEDAGRVPVERTTLYERCHTVEHPLDACEDGDFGSYVTTARDYAWSAPRR
ncbi:MAG: 5-amino-6-(D-ribitylamino)uracil--L-tyrosine 4-hydroxyphenyl transferase CofH [Proteobacteria bacterium]|nr:5-amino-6-(D-ribitylamino)uracil--L-tyrosine 4-hydroxyphenyl transferase CofH [Pseudomonadota bacterium]MCP4922133.1 5-amino-6-(D-ribitylamino)uracil--L-tyrosine 4-hydroxyphenyl transferase CofH [Pseudomonadota bacterium]